MKKLLPLLIMAAFASCAAPKYYSCPKYVGICIDTIPVQFVGGSFGNLLPLTIGRVEQVGHSDTFRIISTKPETHIDTIPEWMHVSMRPKAYVVAQMALSVRVDGVCKQHLDCAGKPFPVHYTVGWCQGKDELFNRLVKEGRAK